jgi:anti-sigma regulatory factor (Ser/Thr protein kinase)
VWLVTPVGTNAASAALRRWLNHHGNPLMNVQLAGPGAARAAREEVRAMLSDQPGEFIETAELLTSELVTNAVVHTGATAVLSVELRPPVLRIEVTDPGPVLSLTPLHVDARCDHGRGLAIVNLLARSWGVEPRGEGKVVWFELHLPLAPERDAGARPEACRPAP